MIKSTDYHTIGQLIVSKLEETLPFVRFSYEFDIRMMSLPIRAEFYSHGERKGIIYHLALARFTDDCIEPMCQSVALYMYQKVVEEFQEKFDPDTDSLIFKMEVYNDQHI